jgi:hypothetical protein
LGPDCGDCRAHKDPLVLTTAFAHHEDRIPGKWLSCDLPPRRYCFGDRRLSVSREQAQLHDQMWPCRASLQCRSPAFWEFGASGSGGGGIRRIGCKRLIDSMQLFRHIKGLTGMYQSNFANGEPAIAFVKKLQMAAMPEVTSEVAGDANPAKLAVGINRLPQPSEEQFGEFIHHITVNHQAYASLFPCGQNQQLRMLKFPFGRMQ